MLCVYNWSLVDGLPKCEKWLRDDDKQHKDAKKSWWLGRLVGRSDKETLEWEYPLSEGRQFVLTIRAGVEGFHVTVDGRHISSFPYRTVSDEDCANLTASFARAYYILIFDLFCEKTSCFL